MKKLTKGEMKQIKGGIGTCMAILECDCSGKDQDQTVNCVYVTGVGWTAGCKGNCTWVATIVDYCNLC